MVGDKKETGGGVGWWWKSSTFALNKEREREKTQ